MITFKKFLELVESSTPERGRRRLSPRGTPLDLYDRLDDRRRTSDRVTLKKAGFKRPSSGELSDDNEGEHYSSDYHGTSVNTHKNQSDYTIDKIQTKKLATGRSRSKVTPTAYRVRQAKALRIQMRGDRTPKKVHDVEILSRTAHNKNDQEDLIARGRSFNQELQNLPKTLRRVGAKPGDKVTAEPLAVMRGENLKTGKEKRSKIYTKKFGSKMNKKTGKMMGNYTDMR